MRRTARNCSPIFRSCNLTQECRYPSRSFPAACHACLCAVTAIGNVSRQLVTWTSLGLALLSAAIASASDLPRTRPEDVGISSERLASIDKFYADKVNNGEMAGIVLLIARHGKIAHLSAIGYANTASHQPMRTDTLFRWYSMTKPITAVALMMLYEEGRFQLHDPVSKYIPQLANLPVVRTPNSSVDDTIPTERGPTVEDLLRHTAGFGLCVGVGGDPVDDLCTKANVYGLDVSLADMMSKLAHIPLRYQPGTRWAYSLSPDVEARLVEVLSGMPFDAFLKQRVFQPLGMSSTGYWLSSEQARRLAAVHWMKNGKPTPWDDVHGHPGAANHQGENTEPISEPWASINEVVGDHKRMGGSFGLVGTAEDYWRFAQMILNDGELDGVRLLSPQVVHYMTRDHLGSIDSTNPAVIGKGTGFGLGFGVTTNAAAAGFMNSEGSIWWDGALATLWWADPKQDLVVVAMTQWLDSGPGLDLLRPQVRALVYGALVN